MAINYERMFEMFKQSLLKIFDKLMNHMVDYCIVILYLTTTYVIWKLFGIHPLIVLPVMAYVRKHFVKS